ncbi:MAG: thioredoxin [Nitrososphaerales archaeon]
MSADEIDQIKARKLKEMMDSSLRPMTDVPIVIDDGNFDSVLAEHPLVVVDCWANWCAPCKMIAPIIDELAKQYSGRIVFCKLDVDSNQLTPHKFQITGIPTLLVFRESKLVDRIVGVVPKHEIMRVVSNHMVST